MSKEYNDVYLNIIERDMQVSNQSAIEQQEYILNSTAKYHGNYVRTCYMPKIFSTEEYSQFESIITTLYGIFEKVIARYYEDPEYRKLFGFDQVLEKLILRCKGKTTIPIARIDIFYNEETGDFKFCEFNTDGSSAMNEDRELNNALKNTKAFQEFSAIYTTETKELFDTWVEEIEDMYQGKEQPNIAIVDFIESASMEEFEEFRGRFVKKGYQCEISDILKMKYRDNILYTESGMPVDIIYRRAVTSDIMKHLDEVKPFMQAVVDNSVTLFGDFFTQIAHNKILYKILHLEQTKTMLDKDQIEFIQRHVPKTFSIRELDLKEIINNKDAWILNPEDSYGSKGVFPGSEFTQREWEEIVNHKIDYTQYIAQEFYTPYKNKNFQLNGKKLEEFEYYNLTGMYVYNSKLRGIYSRISHDKIISTQYNEMAIASVIASKR